MPDSYGDINSPYISGDSDMDDINDIYTGAGAFSGPDAFIDPNVPDEAMDETYQPTSEQQATQGTGGIFSQFLGAGANIYDPESIASSLAQKYGKEGVPLEGLVAGMFPAMSKDLMAASQASTYDSYKRLLSDPKTREYGQMIASSAGMLNPNKRRQRAMRAYKAGMGDISRNIFSKTSAARQGIRNWLSSALSKVQRMKF